MPLTLPVATPRGFCLAMPPGPLLLPLRQKRGLSRPEAPSIDECPLGHACALTSNADPPPFLGLCRPSSASERSFALRYDEGGLDSAASAGSSPAGARCHATLVDFCNRNDPQARPWIDGTPIRTLAASGFRSARDLRKGFSCSFRSGRSRVVPGQGPFYRRWLAPPPLAPRAALARVVSFAPTRLSSDTSCRGPATSPAGVADSVLRAHPASAPLSRRAHPRDVLSLVESRAASRTFPRRNLRFAAPEVPSVVEPPHRGGPVLHTLSPACGVRAWCLCYPRPFPLHGRRD
jgi:hypothetical protein